MSERQEKNKDQEIGRKDQLEQRGSYVLQGDTSQRMKKGYRLDKGKRSIGKRKPG